MRDVNKQKDQRIAELERVESQSKRREQKVQEALRYAESIVETVRGPLVVLDANLTVLSANSNFYATFQATPAETLRHKIYELGDGQWNIPELRALLEGLLSENVAVDDFEVVHDFKDIGRKVMLLNARRIYRKTFGTQTILVSIEDITERRRLENALREAEATYRRAYETASDGILLLERSQGSIVNANPAFRELSGYSIEETIGKKLQDVGVLLHMDDFQGMLQTLDEIGIIQYGDVPVRTKAGKDVNADIYLVDKAKLVQCNIRDISERKQAADKERVNDQKYRIVAENTYDWEYWLDPQDGFVYCSPSCERITGYKAEEFLVDPDLLDRIIHPDHRPAFIRHKTNERRKGHTDEMEFSIIRSDGTRRWIGHTCQTVYDENGVFMGMRASNRDITKRKLAEAELKESKALIEAVVENVPLMIFLKEAEDLRFIIFNRAGEELLGYDRRTLIGKNNLDLFPPKQAVHFMAKDREVLDGDVGFLDIPEEPILTARKGQRLLHTRKVCIRGSDGSTKYLLGVSEDITERKVAEERLKETLEGLRRAISTTIQVLTIAVETRDPYTAGHQRRVTDLARTIAAEMNLPPEQREGIRLAGSIHDIGKISIPAEILSKPTKLTPTEMSLIRLHAEHGYAILKDVGSPWPLAEIVYGHHERMDGSGYPRGLKGDEIIMEARILAVADVVESMASHRPYRPALGIDAALDEIEKNKGILYDPQVSEVCIKLFREKGFRFEPTQS